MVDSKRHPSEIIERGVFDSGMVTKTVVMDEAMALELQMHNKKPIAGKGGTNRQPSALRITEYFNAMMSDEWILSPQPIVLEEPNDNDETDMTDGQQRIAAFLRACKERPGFMLPVTITYDAPARSRLVLDTGKPKHPRDFLRMDGEKHATMLAQAIKLLYVFNEVEYQSVSAWRHVKISVTTQKEYLDKHLGLRGGVDRVKAGKTAVMPYVMATMYYLISQTHDVFVAEKFLEVLEKGIVDGVTTEDARWRLREFLGAKSKESGFKWDGIQQLALLIMAFNDWIEGYDSFRPASALKMFDKAPRFPRLQPPKEEDQGPEPVLTAAGAVPAGMFLGN